MSPGRPTPPLMAEPVRPTRGIDQHHAEAVHRVDHAVPGLPGSACAQRVHDRAGDHRSPAPVRGRPGSWHTRTRASRRVGVPQQRRAGLQEQRRHRASDARRRIAQEPAGVGPPPPGLFNHPPRPPFQIDGRSGRRARTGPESVHPRPRTNNDKANRRRSSGNRNRRRADRSRGITEATHASTLRANRHACRPPGRRQNAAAHSESPRRPVPEGGHLQATSG